MATPQRTMSKTLPTLPKQYTADEWLAIVRPFSELAFVTGSQAFGTARVKTSAPNVIDCEPPSDTDIAIPISDLKKVESELVLRFAVPEHSAYNAGRKYKTQHGELNIVPLHPLDFVCWKLTTEHIQRLVKLCPDAKVRIADRTVKLGTFEILTGLHKTLIPYEGLDTLDLVDNSDKTPY